MFKNTKQIVNNGCFVARGRQEFDSPRVASKIFSQERRVQWEPATKYHYVATVRHGINGGK